MVPSGSQGAVAQLDDTGRGLSGNIRHPEGCLWKNNNVRDVFRLVGFTDFHQVRMTGVMSASRDTQLAEMEKIYLSIAKSLNKKLIY